jgi:hypothetical protein
VPFLPSASPGSSDMRRHQSGIQRGENFGRFLTNHKRTYIFSLKSFPIYLYMPIGDLPIGPDEPSLNVYKWTQRRCEAAWRGLTDGSHSFQF